jgi:uncharacterized protein (TIGR00255 family)
MQSMTGFGRAEARRGALRAVAEVRALNQRFFELKSSLPRGWARCEPQVRELVQKKVARGRVEVSLRIEAGPLAAPNLRINERLARAYVDGLRKLAAKLKLDGMLRVDALLARPEIFELVETDGFDQRAEPVAFAALGGALSALEAERRREGAALRKDFIARLKKLARLARQIEKRTAEVRRTIVAAFKARLAEMLQGAPVDEKRLIEEAAAVAERADITEELTRLRSHMARVRQLLDAAGPSGKAMEFLLQEIGREINTAGAKSPDATLAQLAVAAKSEIEKMREQVQNIE